MPSKLDRFESVVRKVYQFTDTSSREEGNLHPFDAQNIHEKLPPVVRQLFDNGHFAQATFEAFKFIDKEVQHLSGSSKAGRSLMQGVFSGVSPCIQLTPLNNKSEQDEQEGYMFLFSGAIMAIRNPRGHEVGMNDDPDTCLDHLGLASMLLRRLQEAGYTIS